MKTKYVYFIGIEPDGPIKIGCSQAPLKRHRSIGLAVPYETTLLAQCEGSHTIEHLIHLHFDAQRKSGEWFARSPALMELIETIRGGGKWPDFITTVASAPEQSVPVSIAPFKPRIRIVAAGGFKQGDYQRSPNWERVREGVLAGKTYTEIGLSLGVTRERIRQMAGRLGLQGIQSHAHRESKRAEKIKFWESRRAEKFKRNMAILELVKTKSAGKVAAALGLATETVARVCRENGVKLARGGGKRNRYDDAEIERLRCLGLTTAEIAREIGIPDGTLRQHERNKRLRSQS